MCDLVCAIKAWKPLMLEWIFEPMQVRLVVEMRTHGDNILAREHHGNNRSAEDVVHKAWVEWLALEVNVVLLCK